MALYKFMIYKGDTKLLEKEFTKNESNILEREGKVYMTVGGWELKKTPTMKLPKLPTKG